ncbi:MAG: protein-export chaperone SecB [Nevskiaceae bacterium]
MSETAEPGRQLLVQKVYVKDASLEIPLAPQVFTRQWQPQLDVQVTSSMQTLTPEQHHVMLAITITAKLEQDVAFLAEVKQAGVFVVKGLTDEADRKRLLGTECLAILFPFARETVAELVQRGGFPQLLLQPIDFTALYEEHQRKNEAAAH